MNQLAQASILAEKATVRTYAHLCLFANWVALMKKGDIYEYVLILKTKEAVLLQTNEVFESIESHNAHQNGPDGSYV